MVKVIKVYKPKSIVSALSGGVSSVVPGLADKPKGAGTQSAADAAQAEAEAADEAARKLRAREKLRSGAAAANSSGTKLGDFSKAGGNTKTLLGA